MTDIIWEDPPARTGAGRTANPAEVETARQLAKNPEAWGKIRVADDMKKLSTIAQSIRSGKRAGFVQVLGEIEAETKGRFDAVVRQIEESKWGLYVRHTMEPAPEKKRGAAKKTAAKKTAEKPKAAAKDPVAPGPDTAAAFSSQ